MKQYIKKYYTLLVQYFKNYIHNNHLVLFFIFSNVLVATLVRLFSMRSVFVLSPYLADFTIVSLVAAFSYLVKNRYRHRYYMISSIFLTVISFINIVYYGYYNSFTSIQMIQVMNMLGDVADSLTFNVFQPYQFIVLLQPISLYLYIKHLKSNVNQEIKKDYHKLDLMYFQQTLIMAGIALLLFLSLLQARDYSRLVKQWNREYIVMKFGIYSYQINDLIKSIEPKISSMFGYDKALKTYRDFYANKPNTNVNPKYTNIFAGKNLLMIHAESIQNNLINLSFNNQAVTPNLNKMAKEGLYFNNFYAQTSVGTSSDAEFIINTSLLPVSNGTVFISYSDSKFVSMPQLFADKGYSTFSMHANNGTFWNRKVMHKNLGYQRFYDKDSYKIDDSLGLGLSDESFFKQSVEKITKIKQPFYGTLIMLSNHTPFNETAERSKLDLTMKYIDPITKEEKIAPYMSETRLGKYFMASNYADYTIGILLENLDAAGLLDNTVVVIYGDHDAKLPKKDYRLMYNYDPVLDKELDNDDPRYKEYADYQYELNRNTAFIIWTKEQKVQKKIKTATGMIDVLPILGNMFGFNNEYQLGNDTTNMNDNLVALPNGNWISNNGYFQKAIGDTLLKGFIPFNNSYVTSEYLQKNTDLTESMIDASNALIVYDLVRKNPLIQGAKNEK